MVWGSSKSWWGLAAVACLACTGEEDGTDNQRDSDCSRADERDGLCGDGFDDGEDLRDQTFRDSGAGDDSCSYALDGECDDPDLGGTGWCWSGTDATDCADALVNSNRGSGGGPGNGGGGGTLSVGNGWVLPGPQKDLRVIALGERSNVEEFSSEFQGVLRAESGAEVALVGDLAWGGPLLTLSTGDVVSEPFYLFFHETGFVADYYGAPPIDADAAPPGYLRLLLINFDPTTLTVQVQYDAVDDLDSGLYYDGPLLDYSPPSFAPAETVVEAFVQNAITSVSSMVHIMDCNQSAYLPAGACEHVQPYLDDLLSLQNIGQVYLGSPEELKGEVGWVPHDVHCPTNAAQYRWCAELVLRHLEPLDEITKDQSELTAITVGNGGNWVQQGTTTPSGFTYTCQKGTCSAKPYGSMNPGGDGDGSGGGGNSGTPCVGNQTPYGDVQPDSFCQGACVYQAAGDLESAASYCEFLPGFGVSASLCPAC